MKQLPQYWYLQKDEKNLLWDKFKTWFNKKANYNWSNSYIFYGYHRTEDYNGYDCWTDASYFSNNHPTEITLEEWDQAVNSFTDKKKIIGYKAPFEMTNGLGKSAVKSGDLFVLNSNDYYYHLHNDVFFGLPKEIVEQWEPIYEEQIEPGDWVTFHNALTGRNITSKLKEWTPHSYCILEDGSQPSKYLVRAATDDEIKAATIQIISVGGKFEVKVQNGEVFHKNSNITSFVKSMIEHYKHSSQTIWFGGFKVVVNDVIFSRTGCEESITKLSDWKEVAKAMENKY